MLRAGRLSPCRAKACDVSPVAAGLRGSATFKARSRCAVAPSSRNGAARMSAASGRACRPAGFPVRTRRPGRNWRIAGAGSAPSPLPLVAGYNHKAAARTDIDRGQNPHPPQPSLQLSVPGPGRQWHPSGRRACASPCFCELNRHASRRPGRPRRPAARGIRPGNAGGCGSGGAGAMRRNPRLHAGRRWCADAQSRSHGNGTISSPTRTRSVRMPKTRSTMPSATTWCGSPKATSRP